MDSRCSTYHRTCWTSSTDFAADTHQSTHIIMAGRLSTWHVETSPPFTSGPKTQSTQESGRYRMRTFSWRLNERIIVCSVPRKDGAEGSFGRMKTESVHPGHWEERTRDRGARPGRRLHPLARPRAHQTVARLDESGTIPPEPGNGCVIISKKTSTAPLPFAISHGTLIPNGFQQYAG